MAIHNLQFPKRLAVGLLSTGAAALLAACGNSADTTMDSTTAPDAPMTTEAPAPDAPTAAAGNTVIDVAANNEEFSTLVQAIEAAELTAALENSSPITVFAPTNAAFEALPPGTLDELLLPENQDLLRQVLTYHVLQQEVSAAEVTTGEVPTAAGPTVALMVDESSGAVRVNDAQVIEADIAASNGVIHVIDQVILPPDLAL